MEHSLFGVANLLLRKIIIFPENILFHEINKYDRIQQEEIGEVAFKKNAERYFKKYLAITLIEELEHFYQNHLSLRYIRHEKYSKLKLISYLLGLILISNLLIFKISLLNMNKA